MWLGKSSFVLGSNRLTLKGPHLSMPLLLGYDPPEWGRWDLHRTLFRQETGDLH